MKAVVFSQYRLTWIIKKKNQYLFYSNKQCPNWDNDDPTYDNSIYYNIYGKDVEDLFVSYQREKYVLKCALKENNK